MSIISAHGAESYPVGLQENPNYVTFEGKQIPVIKSADVLVVGSTLDACFLTSKFAKDGRSAVLASAGTSLPHELIMCQRPWVKRSRLDSSYANVKAFLTRCVRKEAGDDYLLDMIYTTGKHITAQAGKLPVVATCELVVVGGGTSGMPAALVATRQGVDTILVEKFGDVGGTHTIGGVSKYWFGRETDFVGRLDRDAGRTMQATGMPKCMGMLGWCSHPS